MVVRDVYGGVLDRIPEERDARCGKFVTDSLMALVREDAGRSTDHLHTQRHREPGSIVHAASPSACGA
jgi:hypothetical protein